MSGRDEASAAEIGLVTAALISAAGTVGLKPPEYAERARQVLVALACIREDEGERFDGWVVGTREDIAMEASVGGLILCEVLRRKPHEDDCREYGCIPATLILRAPQPREDLHPPTGDEL